MCVYINVSNSDTPSLKLKVRTVGKGIPGIPNVISPQLPFQVPHENIGLHFFSGDFPVLWGPPTVGVWGHFPSSVLLELALNLRLGNLGCQVVPGRSGDLSQTTTHRVAHERFGITYYHIPHHEMYENSCHVVRSKQNEKHTYLGYTMEYSIFVFFFISQS